MRLEDMPNPLQLDQRFGKMFSQIRDWFRRSHAGDDIWKLEIEARQLETVVVMMPAQALENVSGEPHTGVDAMAALKTETPPKSD